MKDYDYDIFKAELDGAADAYKRAQELLADQDVGWKIQMELTQLAADHFQEIKAKHIKEQV